jgi:hypothetical protein
MMEIRFSVVSVFFFFGWKNRPKPKTSVPAHRLSFQKEPTVMFEHHMHLLVVSLVVCEVVCFISSFHDLLGFGTYMHSGDCKLNGDVSWKPT